MKLNAWGARKTLVVAAMGCMGTILAAGPHREQSTAPTVAAKKDGHAEIAAHAAEWLKESDVPSVAVAYIEDRKVAWTEVYGEQSPGVAATGICTVCSTFIALLLFRFAGQGAAT